MDENDYSQDLQYRHDFDELTKALQSLSEGRNKDCYPLVSFGWKDADLDPQGCTGIDKIISLDDSKVTVNVGGHKTFCPSDSRDDTELSEVEWAEQEFINDIGYPGYWSGDDWTISTDEEVAVEWIMDEELGSPDYIATAKLIIEEARKAISLYEKDMTQAHKDFYALSEEDE